MVRPAQIALTALFLSMLTAPPLLSVLAPDTSDIPDENRLRAAPPPLALDSTARRAFEAWFGDHMGLRYHLVKGHYFLKYFALGVAPNDNLLVGRDGWLFVARDHGLDSLRAERPFAPDDLDRWERLLGDLQRWLAERDIALLVVIAPNKATIYPDKLPPGVEPVSPRSRADELVGRLARAPVPLLDLRDTLREARRVGAVYDKRDTHWNGYGAWVAYRAVAERLAGRLDLRPHELEEVKIVGERRAGDLSKLIPLGRWMHDEYLRVEPVAARSVRTRPPASVETLVGEVKRHLVFEVEEPGLPRAVVYRDSFATALMPLLAEHFGRSVWRWTRDLEPELIEAERPDVVIYELAERYLMAEVPENALASSATLASARR